MYQAICKMCYNFSLGGQCRGIPRSLHDMRGTLDERLLLAKRTISNIVVLEQVVGKMIDSCCTRSSQQDNDQVRMDRPLPGVNSFENHT